MLHEEDYTFIWQMYYLGSLLCVLCFFQLTRWIGWVRLRRVLRAIVLAFFCTPWYSDSDYTQFAPAFIITAFEGVISPTHNFLRAGTPLLIAISLCALVALLWPVSKTPAAAPRHRAPPPPPPVRPLRKEPVMPNAPRR